ncbi:MAG: hypothetical protein H6551_00365 [Chitinophagales bacterium]|nr:hypothetical protein [Chitinophagaceae bacterium]MCB9063574.1 hypothetical protein [Chitinophagales bacterium]
MPVKLLQEDNSTDPRVISLQEYTDGRANFDLHYYYTSAEAAFGGKVNDAQWDDLQNAVDNYCSTAGVPHAEVALRFVHCFDPVPGNMYQRLQICRMVPQPPSGSNEEIFDLDTTDAQWYEIKDGAFNPTPDDDLYGQDYLNDFYYKVEPQTMEMEQLVLGPDKYVKNLVFPWENEVLRMYAENGSPASAGIHFAACSYTAEYPGYANVDWPHGMVIYLSDSNGQPYLNNEDYITIFHNKGADMGTLCPPNCGVYIAP